MQPCGSGALLFSGYGNRCTSVLKRRKLKGSADCCSQEKEIGVFLYLGEGKKCSTVFRRRDLVLYCSQEKATGILLFSGERNRCFPVFRRMEKVLYCFRRRKLVHYNSPQGDGNWCSTAHVFRRRKLVLYYSREKGNGAVLIGFI